MTTVHIGYRQLTYADVVGGAVSLLNVRPKHVTPRLDERRTHPGNESLLPIAVREVPQVEPRCHPTGGAH